VDGENDVEGLKRAGAAVAEARDAMGRCVAPGVTTLELDAVGRDVLARHGARSAPALAYGFPAATCISVNDQLAHGIPSATRVLREGDLVNIDVSAELDGYWADTGASFAVGSVSRRASALLWATRTALAEAMSEARAGAPLHNIGRAVERRAKRSGFRVIRDGRRLLERDRAERVRLEARIARAYDDERPRRELLRRGAIEAGRRLGAQVTGRS